MYSTLTPEALVEKIKAGEVFLILDVREPEELAIASIGATHIPLGDLPHRYQELPEGKTIAVLCHHGMRSARAAQLLISVGFEKVVNISGGIARWSQAVDPSIPQY